MRRLGLVFSLLGLAVLFGFIGPSGVVEAKEGQSLDSEFGAAASKYNVPKELLMAMGHVNTRWEMPPPSASDYEKGDPEGRGTYGVMALIQNPSSDTLGKAADLTKLSEDKLKTDRESNVMGGAAVLADLQGNNKPSDLNGWYAAVSKYGGGSTYATQVYQTLKDGASEDISTGEHLELKAQDDVEVPQTFTAQSAADYWRATWYGNGGNNYSNYNREADGVDINTIVIHVTQGSWSSAINWFASPDNTGSSAHYTIRSSDGKIGQSVREEDVAWHAGWWATNKHSIGIEHEGYIDDPSWFTGAMYRSSAKLVAHLAAKYHIPIDRQHIIGHNEVPGCPGPGGGSDCHTDPGKYWDWKRYMRLVRGYAGSSDSNTYKQVVDNSDNRFSASGAWDYSTYHKSGYGKNYRYTKPKNVSDPATFKFKVPSKGKYWVSAWWPADQGYNGSTRFSVRTTSGWKTVTRSQRKNGGQWVSLGDFTLARGDQTYVRVSRRSSSNGYIIADAARIVEN